MGAGIASCGEWIDAILQLWVQCRGDVGQLILCQGISYVIAPQIGVGLAPRPLTGDHMADAEQGFTYILTPELYLALAGDGWRYRAPAPGEYANWKPLDAYPTRGPFADPEDAIRDAMDNLGIRPSWMWEAMAAGAHPDLGRALMVLHAATSAE